MNNEQKLKVNMRAAKLLYPNDATRMLPHQPWKCTFESSNHREEFDIFTNVQDLFDAVLKLSAVDRDEFIEGIAAAVMEVEL